MSQDARRKPRKPLLINLLWAAVLGVVLFVVYAMSYPVAVRLTSSTVLPAYRPVEWLIDNTPVREPMFRWAEFCGVRDGLEWEYFLRVLRKYADPDSRVRPLVPDQPASTDRLEPAG